NPNQWSLYHSTSLHRIPDDFVFDASNSSLHILASHQIFTRLSICKAIVLSVKSSIANVTDVVARGHGLELSAAIRRMPDKFNLKAKWVRGLRAWLDAPRDYKTQPNGDVLMVDRYVVIIPVVN